MSTSLREQLQSALGDTYVIERELPRGGMSRVFAAREKALGRTVVIKVLSPELIAGLSAERFRREIALAARLQHPNIVPLLTSGEAANSVYYTMPLVDGDSLRERMSRERPMSIENVTRILEEVASALDYAHQLGIVHRDIKPENVMFFHDKAVVLDFGIGKAITAAANVDPNDPAAARITRSGTTLGTPTYIPPEQAAGDPGLDHRADIYSLGVVAYEMITGHPPFAGRNAAMVLSAHANEPPQPISQRRQGVPAPLAKVVMQCLEKSPDRRPQRADDIVRALRGTPPRGARAAASGPAGAVSNIPVWVPWVIALAATVTAIFFAVKR